MVNLIPGAKARVVAAENYDWYLEASRSGPIVLTLDQILAMDGLVVEYAHGPWTVVSKANFDMTFKRMDTEEVNGWFSVTLKSREEQALDDAVSYVRRFLGEEISEVVSECTAFGTEYSMLGETDIKQAAADSTTDIYTIIARFLLKKGR